MAVAALLSVASVATAARAAKPLVVRQLQFPIPLVVRGDVVEVGYEAVGRQAATGYLFVRNDRQARFTRVRLTLRKATPPRLTVSDGQKLLRAIVPPRLLSGRKLLYYAVVGDPKTGRSVNVPAAGARAPESVWIVNTAIRVRLGTHRFGRTQAPEAVVARAGAADVGFENPPEGARFGPWSFEVAPDRSLWLLDELNERLLVWGPGSPDTVEREVPLPAASIDFALGPAGTVYVTRPADPDDPPAYPGGLTPLRLARVTATGEVIWESRIATDIFNTQLRTGSDGTLYWTGYGSARTERSAAAVWAPAATPGGSPLSLSEQRRRMSFGLQPLAGGRWFVSTVTGFEKDQVYGLAPHEQRFAIVGRTGRLVRAWRVTSETVMWPHLQATPALVGGDPVVVVEMTRGSGQSFEWEFVVLRLAKVAGGTRVRFSLPHDPPQAAWGDVITGLRIGPDSKLYQLGSSPETGVTIGRHSLGPA